MKNFKNTSGVAGQSDKRFETSQKHDANLQKNSSLYFQVGLILCLLATYGLFEMQFEKANYNIGMDPIGDDAVYINFTVEQPLEPVVEKTKPRERKVVLSVVDPIIKDDNAVIDKNIDIVVDDIEPVIKAPVAKAPVDPVQPIVDSTPIGVNFVQDVPVYPGCESASTNQERLACMSEKLGKLIQKKFNPDLAADLGLSGIQKIYVQFKIDKNGQVTDIQSRAPYVQLEDEAKRVVNKIPVMVPGKQNKVAVDVIYNLPIIFKVQ